jgi:hypothetical protein
MKPLTINFRDDKFHIEEYPEAEKVVTLDHPQAKRFTDLALHQADLEFAIGCLEGINRVPAEPSVLREGLWRSAITHVLKCFDTTAGRVALDSAIIYGGEPLAIQAFDYFKKLRNKHLVHDENAWLQCYVGVILNKEGAPRPIEDVTYLAFRICTLEQEKYGNLMLLSTKARTWVLKELDAVHAVILADLKNSDVEQLRNCPDLRVQMPAHTDLGRKR